MSFNFSDILKYADYLPFFDTIKNTIHDIGDKDSSKDKAADVIEDLVDGAIPLVKRKNPALAGLLDEARDEIHKVLDPWKDKPVISAPAPSEPPAATPPPATTPAAPYDTWENYPLPGDAELISRFGFKAGDWKWTNATQTQWLVGHSGGSVSGNFVGPITA